MDTILQRIQKGEILVGDGGWGTFLISAGLQSGECPELWNLTHPEVIEHIAREYKLAGSDIVSTNSFGGNSIKLKSYGLADRTREINRRSAYLTRKVVGEDTHVLASMGPSGKFLMMGEVSREELYDAFREQAIGLEEGGADACIIETMVDIEEALCALQAVRDNTSLEVVVSFTFSKSSDGSRFHTIMGVTPEQMIGVMVSNKVGIVGVNCTLGAEDMWLLLQRMYAYRQDIPFLVYPNAGQPEWTESGIRYPEGPEVLGGCVSRYVQYGARILGGCCGTTPEHIKKIREVLKQVVN